MTNEQAEALERLVAFAEDRDLPSDRCPTTRDIQAIRRMLYDRTDRDVGRVFDVDGKCRVCGTQIVTEVAGRRVRFVPHDDPNWCREMAMFNAKALTRALEQANEDSGIARHRESYYRSALAIALNHLSGILPSTDWDLRVEIEAKQEMANAAERIKAAAVLAASDKIGAPDVG